LVPCTDWTVLSVAGVSQAIDELRRPGGEPGRSLATRRLSAEIWCRGRCTSSMVVQTTDQ